LLCEHFELRGSRDEDHLRLQCDDSLETRMKRVTDFSNRFRFRRKVTITRASHEAITGADSKNDFRKVRRKRDYAIDFGRNADTSPCIVRNLPSGAIIRRSSGSTGRKRYADNNRQPRKCRQRIVATGKHRPHILNHLCFLCLFVANTFFQ